MTATLTPPVTPPPVSEPARPGAPGTALLVAAAAAAGAGLVHAAAAGSHNGDTTLMWLFALTAAAQLAWATAAILRPGRAVAVAGALLNGGAALAWVASRTVGLVGPLAGVEAVGTQDLAAAILGGVAATGALLALRTASDRPAHRAVPVLAGVCVLALAVPAMAADHTHGPSHEHGHGHDGGVAAADDHAHGARGGHSHPKGNPNTTVTGPIVSLDDPRLTKQQRKAAQQLLDASRAALARFPDEAAVVAAGYRSIGDGRRVGGFEHFVNPAFMRDSRELDPDAIESIVLQRQADGSKKVVSAMYILEPGKTMADVPDIAGGLTTWHDHQNLCWDETGLRLAGVIIAGRCVPGGTFRPTPPMLHVWVDDPPCGPFTGIEGHGGGSCEHSHAS